MAMSITIPLTPLQERIRRYLRTYRAARGCLPSATEIAERFDLVTRSAQALLDAIRRKGGI